MTAKEHVPRSSLISSTQPNPFSKRRWEQIRTRSLLANSNAPALLQAAAARHVELLGLNERILLAITTVSFAEWLPLITANITSHEESQSALRSIGGDKDASSEAFQERWKAGSWRRHAGGGGEGVRFCRQMAS